MPVGTFETLLSTLPCCCLSTMINVKSLKNSKIHQRNFHEKGYRKHNSSEWGPCWISYSFAHLSPIIPDASLHKNYETFLLQRNCFNSNLIPLLGLLSSHPECMDLCVSAIQVLTQLNTVPLLLDLTQGDHMSCHTILLFQFICVIPLHLFVSFYFGDFSARSCLFFLFSLIWSGC